MNIPNKLTITRIVMSVLIVIILLIPFDAIGIPLPKLFVNELIVIDLKYIIAGLLFTLASLTDLLDGFLARKKKCITNLGKMLDAIADKMLVNPVLIVLASAGFVHPIIPVILVMRDSIVNALKMEASAKGNVVGAIKIGKVKTACLMIGTILTLFYNMPFELFNLKVAEILLIVATILSVISGVEYYNLIKKKTTEIENLEEKEHKNLEIF